MSRPVENAKVETTDLSDEELAGVRGGTGQMSNDGALGTVTSQQDAWAAMGAMQGTDSPGQTQGDSGSQQQGDDRNAFITKIF